MITEKRPGRKKLADPKMAIRIYIETSFVNGVGGEEAAKVVASDAIKNLWLKLKTKKNGR